MIEIGIRPDNKNFVCQTITPAYMGIGIGTRGKTNEWHAAILIEFEKKDQHQVYELLDKSCQQNRQPVTAINIPGESVVVFEALIESKASVSGLLEKEIPFDTDFHLYLVLCLVHEEKKVDHENFFELGTIEGFYFLNIIERKDTESDLKKVLFSFKLEKKS